MDNDSVETINPNENVKQHEPESKNEKLKPAVQVKPKVTSTPSIRPFPDPDDPHYCPPCGLG